jgi:hypothetical protein
MSLSQPAISAIVSALLHERKTLAADLAFWSARARRAGKTSYCQQISQSLQENTTALVELANGMAPWLRQHPEYVLINKEKDTA